MAVKFGLDCKVYRQSSGTRAAWPGTGAAPNLTEINCIEDQTVAMEKEEADASIRSSTWEMVASKFKRAPITLTLKRTGRAADDAHLVALRAAFINGTTIALAVLDGESTTYAVEGIWADFDVLKFQRNEPLRGIVTYEIDIKPGVSSVDPEWVIVQT
jgi:hypothetical protein